MCGEENRESGRGFFACIGVSVDEALGEGLDEGRLLGPGFDEGEGGFRRGGVAGGFGLERGGEGAAVEAGAGAGVLRSEAEGEDAGDAFGEQLVDHVGNEGMPVSHCDVDRHHVAGLLEGKLEQAGLFQRPAGEGRGLGAGRVAEADLRVAVLQLGDNMGWEGPSAGDFGEVLGHLAEDVRGTVGEQEDGGGGIYGLAHAGLVCDPPGSILRGSQGYGRVGRQNRGMNV